MKTINLRSRMSTSESRIQREARAIARLHHPNIVAAFDSGFHEGRFCIAMELVEGETLAAFIGQHAPISEVVTWNIARQVASALSHACEQGIVHRDIKPANLLLAPAPAGTQLSPDVPLVKVVDFGLALEQLDSNADQLTATGATLGTPAYVAPEQLQDTHVDARADIYSLGATVFHMLTGRAPCADRSPMKTILQKTIGDDGWRDELPSTVSHDSVALFRGMTETDPKNRIADYAELIGRIDQLLAGTSPFPIAAEYRVQPATPAVAAAAASGIDRTLRHSENSDTIEVRDIRSDTVRRVAPSRWVWLHGNRPVAWTLLLMLSVFIPFSIWLWHPNSLQRDTSVVSTWAANGIPQPLFNGESVPLFRQSGSWSAVSANDGARVLLGGKGARMTIPLAIKGKRAADLRLRLGVNLSDDAMIELALIGRSGSEACATLRLDDGLTHLITGDASQSRGISLRSSQDGDVVFQQVQIHRQGEHLVVDVNGSHVGQLYCDADPIESVVLRCMEGEARFADIDIVDLVAVTP